MRMPARHQPEAVRGRRVKQRTVRLPPAPTTGSNRLFQDRHACTTPAGTRQRVVQIKAIAQGELLPNPTEWPALQLQGSPVVREEPGQVSCVLNSGLKFRVPGFWVFRSFGSRVGVYKSGSRICGFQGSGILCFRVPGFCVSGFRVSGHVPLRVRVHNSGFRVSGVGVHVLSRAS